jgi:hypothetical protein
VTRCSLLFALLAGCSAVPAPPTIVVEQTAPPAPSAAPTTAREPLAPAPPVIEAPGQQGCLLPTSASLSLRFRADGPAFATLGGTSATIDLTTAGPAAGAAARAVRAGFTLQGIVSAIDLELGPARALTLGGFLVPLPSARFAWKGTAPGTIQIGFALEAEIEILPEAGLDKASLPCDAVSLDHPSFDTRTAFPRGPKEKEMLVRAGKVVPLSRTPEAPPVARLRFTGDDASVTLVEKRGRHALVRREEPTAILFGWVATADLHVPPADSIGDAYGIGDLGLTGTGAPLATRVVHCDRDIPLVAEMAGERRTIGTVAAGTALSLLDRKGDIIAVVLPDKLAATEPEAHLGVLASHVAGCVERR